MQDCLVNNSIQEADMSAQQVDPGYWGIDNDYGVLRDVLLGRPDYFKWVEAGPLIGRTLKNMHKTGIEFDFELAQGQHREMVRIYEEAGVSSITSNPTRCCIAISLRVIRAR